jgi:hypothetical protein
MSANEQLAGLESFECSQKPQQFKAEGKLWATFAYKKFMSER